MTRRMRKMTLLAVLPLLIASKSSAMIEMLKETVSGLYDENKITVWGTLSTVGGLGLGGVMGRWSKSSFVVPEDKKLVDVGATLLKPEEIAVLQNDVRAKLGLDGKIALPENVVDVIFEKGKNEAFEQGFDEGKKQGTQESGEVMTKLKALYKGGNYPKNWDKQTLGDYKAIKSFLDKKHPGYEEGDLAGKGKLALDALHKQTVLVAKKVFDDKNEVLQGETLQGYLFTKRLMYQKDIKKELNKLKLTVAKLLVQDYSGKDALTDDDFGEWVAKMLKENFKPKKKDN